MALRTLPMYDIEKPVGPGKPNLPDDVRLIQSLFMHCQAVNDVVMAGTPKITVTGFYSDDLGAAILQFQKTLRQSENGWAVDGFVSPLPKSRSGLSGDWDYSFRNGVRSVLVLLNYRLFRINRDTYFKVGDSLNLKWVPDPYPQS